MTAALPLRAKAVLIDLDGTLLDTIPDLAAATNMMLTELGRAALETSVIRTFVGKGIRNLVERALAGRIDGKADAELVARALPVFERCYSEVNGRYTTIYPGVKEGLERLRSHGLPLACVTNKSTRYTLPLLEMVGLASYFKAVVAGDTLPLKKPDPAPLLHACEALGVAPREMVMIGDSVNDAQAARAAGCPVICVTYGYNEGMDVRALETDALVDTLDEAARLVCNAR
ncbi:MAG TPA: phosphoglycolate phosphatase [Burkholderiales bacterium]|nr:phosphoglycolate phosphatase [Burkholderiales bacterium]